MEKVKNIPAHRYDTYCVLSCSENTELLSSDISYLSDSLGRCGYTHSLLGICNSDGCGINSIQGKALIFANYVKT